MSQFIGANISAIAIITALYFGAYNSNFIKKIENSILNRNINYSAQSHQGNLNIEETRNSKGEIELKLKNEDLGTYVYTIQSDYLPDNEFLINGLEGRVESMSESQRENLSDRMQGINEMLGNDTNYTPYVFGGLIALIGGTYLRMRRSKVPYIK